MTRWVEVMGLKIVNYPHPTLRHVSKAVRRVDAELRGLVDQMFELMYAANGIGLAANQVDLPLRLFICNLTATRGEGEEHVFVNPVLSRHKGTAEREEGCLSFPGLYAPVRRPDTVRLQAYSLDGKEIELELDGLLSRVVQHEVDHLDGVLFTDRLSPTHELNVRPVLEEFELEFKSRRQAGEIPLDPEITARLADLERSYAAVV
jgi:peptide deformylase